MQQHHHRWPWSSAYPSAIHRMRLKRHCATSMFPSTHVKVTPCPSRLVPCPPPPPPLSLQRIAFKVRKLTHYDLTVSFCWQYWELLCQVTGEPWPDVSPNHARKRCYHGCLWRRKSGRKICTLLALPLGALYHSWAGRHLHLAPKKGVYRKTGPNRSPVHGTILSI